MLRRLHLRPARAADCAFVSKAVRTLHQMAHCAPELPEIKGIDECFHRLINGGPNWAVLVGEEGGVPVGMVTLTFSPTMHLGGDTCVVEELVVDVAHRGSGVGAEMVKAIEEYARQREMKEVMLYQPPAGSQGHEGRSRFYERNGFNARGVARGKVLEP